LSKEDQKKLREKFNIGKTEIKTLHKVWMGYAKKDGTMDLDGFKRFCDDVGSDDGNVPTIYSFIDTSGDGAIQFDEWIVFVLRAKDPTFDDYAQLVIDLYDTDGSGTVSRAEVRKLALSKAKTEGRLTDARIAEIDESIDAIFKFADTNGDGELTKEELVDAAKRDPQFAQAL